MKNKFINRKEKDKSNFDGIKILVAENCTKGKAGGAIIEKNRAVYMFS